MFMDPCIIVQFIKKIPTRCKNVSTFYYSIFIRSSTCFGRHITHHQEPKTALAASGFSYVEGCWTCSWWTLSGTKIPTFGIEFCNVTEHLIPLFFKSNAMVTVVYMILQTGNTFDVCGSIYHSTIHKEKSNKIQQCIKILLFHIYMKLNMFRATHHPSSGA